MRPELAKAADTKYWLYGLSEYDFGYTIELIDRFIAPAQREVEAQRKHIAENHPNSSIHAEAVGDLAYYTWLEQHYFWHFGLWRMQGVLEGLIESTFLPPSARGKTLLGLRAKLDAMRQAGYSVTDEDAAELLRWANLRNTLSHAPPEQYRPIHLDREDLLEYKAFVESLCKVWRQQETAIHGGV